MYGGFFGDFLIKEGVITAEDLSSAVASQRQHNKLFGHLAKSHGWLDDEALSRLLEEQASRHVKLGTLAVESGLMSNEKIEELLEEQAHNHLYLGDALVRTGILDQGRLDHYLALFNEDIKNASESMAEKLSQLEDKDLLQLVIDAYRSYFFRLGYVVKIEDILKTPFTPAPNTIPFLGSYRLRHHRTVHIGPVFPESVVMLLASGGSSTAQEQEKRTALEYLEELFYGLNFQTCRQTHGPGKAHVGAIRNTVPNASAAVVFSMIGLTEQFQLVYFD